MADSKDATPQGHATDPRLEALMEDFVNRRRRGEQPSVSEYAAKHPDLAEKIHEVFPAMVFLEELEKGPNHDNATAPLPLLADGKPIARLGEYRVLREIGRGGMGVVYEAEQESLGRHVALKVLAFHRLLDPKHLERFRREARAAASLQHPNIVPVYGFGQEDNVHFYIMQFVAGQGLDEVLVELKRVLPRGADPRAPLASSSSITRDLLTDERAAAPLAPRGGRTSHEHQVAAPGAASPSPLAGNGDKPASREGAYFRRVARLCAQVADALAYAHGQGILHRDIKPSNLLLDTRGTIWVTDFGLAKAEDSEQLTESGEIMGTLRYMAPERLRGWSDPRSDVYSLGLTLYELLTLEPAYDDDDRGRLVKKILEEPPPRPGRRRPGIARDLETVVLTAISKEPGDRYQTAREFHDDLERFLEGKPIQAKPASTWERGMKWARRRPAAAALVVVSSLALMTLLLGTTWYNSRLQVAAERAGRNLEDSRKAMEVMLRWFAERRLKSQQGIDQVSRQVAEEARNFYDVLERQAISPIVQRDVARAYRRIGDLERSLGQVTQAETDYRRAADVWRRGGFGHELAAEDRAEGRTIHNRWSMALAVCDQAGEAEDAYRTTLSFMDEAPRFSFIRSAKFPVGAGPIGFTVGDWNGDGKIDLATTCIFANNVTALLAAGAGAFSAPLFFAAGNRPISLASGDLDGDRDLDLAVANRDSLSLSILANDGAGGFSASEDYRLADRVWGVRAGDLDGDHRLDLAAVTGVTGAPDSDLWVARNRGGGKFSDPERCPSQGGPNDLAIADVEGDGDLDVLVACTGAAATNYLGCVALHVNDGRGSLTARNDLAAGPTPRFVTAADLDGDGAPDLVASNWQVDKVSVLRNLGSTKFAEPLPLETGLQPHGTIACDLDDDRDLDLAVASIDSDEVNVFASRGNGTYLPPVSFAAGDGTCFLGAADADGDGRPDLLAVNMNSNDISLLFNRPAAKPDEAAAPAGPAQEGR